MKIFLVIAISVGCAFAQFNPNFAPNHYGLVHLFEWQWNTIADECETMLAQSQVGGVQISPPNENHVIDGRPWWERYQPVSYILGTRSGDRTSFINMVQRCNAVGVRIYADIVINHMCGKDDSGTGTAGSTFDSNINNPNFPQVPYGRTDFNTEYCYTESGQIESYLDEVQVRDCMLYGLLDLNQKVEHVQDMVIAYMNDLIDIGVAGFRIDAAKHMWPNDLSYLFSSLNNLNSTSFGNNERPFIYSEVFNEGGDAVTATDYTDLGTVTEFNYGFALSSNKNDLESLGNLGVAWGLIPSDKALVFVNNHDNQRGHGGAGDVVTFKDKYDLKILTVYMLAYPYGIPRVMSSYYFEDADQGAPDNQRGVTSNGLCTNGWVCEHRWREIRNMFAFANVVQGTTMQNWWTNGNNQIAFSRENKGFLAINNHVTDMSETLQTGLPAGSYCNVISGDFEDGTCTGECIDVDSTGFAHIFIYANSADPIVALHIEAVCTGSGGSTGGGTICTDCNCDNKATCGYLGIGQNECENQGCLWCPSNTDGDSWCIMSQYSTDGSPSCGIEDSTKQNCVAAGTSKELCESYGCCWQLSNTIGIPSCYFPV